jgi:hypothetical protein
MKRDRAIAMIFGSALIWSGFSFAATTSRLRVTVEDHAGHVLEGATVRVESPALIGGAQTGTTDVTGEITFNLLPQGQYTVEAGIEGFLTADASVPVRLDRTAAVDFRLVPLAFEDEINVAAAVPVLDVTQTDMSQVFDLQYLQRAAIGMDNRSFQKMLEQAPGTLQGSNPKVFGSTGSENAYLVDGINETDPSTGMFARPVTFDAIDEVSVLTVGFDAEYGQATGGVVNAVTKSGGNNFSGTVDVRYRDEGFNESGEHYDPDDDASSQFVGSATLGGPILRDRLWFFAALEYFQDTSTPTGALAPFEETNNNFLAKITWAASHRHRISALYLTRFNVGDNLWINESTLPEATTHLEIDGPKAQIELNSVLSDSLLLTVTAGIDRSKWDFRPQSGDLETPAEWDLDTNLAFSNGWYAEYGQRNRDLARGVLTAFAGDLAGSHELKIGGEYQRLHTDEGWFRPGGCELWYFNNAYWDDSWPDSDGDGLVDLLLYQDYPVETARDPLRSTVGGRGIFLQDAWRPLSSLTVSASLRYDSMAHTNTVGETIADFEKWQPRVGFAWNIGGRGKHVFRASWGRFTHAGVTNLGALVPGLERGYAEYFGLDYLCGDFGICDRETARAIFGDESELVHVDTDGDEHPFYLSALYSTPAETVDTLGVGRLRMPYQDQLLLAFETQIYDQTSVELSYVDASYGDLIEDTCLNNTWVWGDGAPPNLEDRSTWTDESSCTGSVRANLEGLKRSYEAWILEFESRARSWFHIIGSYTYSKNRGNAPYTQPFYGFGSDLSFPEYEYDIYPTNFLNLDGDFGNDHRHHVKLNGFFLLPSDIAIGVAAFYLSAPPLPVWTTCQRLMNPSPGDLEELERLGINYEESVAYCQSPSSGAYLLEPTGGRRAGDGWQLDLEFSKGFSFGQTNLRALVTVLNVFSEQAATSWTSNPFDSRGWGVPTSYQQPRRYEVGFRVEF